MPDTTAQADDEESFTTLAVAASRLGCDLRALPGDRYRITRSGVGRTFATKAELVTFLRVVQPS